MVSLPIEMYRDIISEVNSLQDLRALARVSRIVQPEAERLIWRSYYSGFIPGIIRFCNALSSAPRFGPYVHELDLGPYIPNDLDSTSDADIVDMLSRALEKTINLRILDIGLSISAPCTCSSLFERSTFQLHTFRPHWLLIDDRMVAFLARQPSIRYMHPRIRFDYLSLLEVDIPSGVLPHLAIISGPDSFISNNLRDRPITHISFDHHIPHSILKKLPLSASPIKGVELYHNSVLEEHEALRSVHFARLELLCGLCVYGEKDEELYLSLISTFKMLQAIVVCTHFGKDRLKSFIAKCGEACLSLKRVQISLENESHYVSGFDSENHFWRWDAGVGWRQYDKPVGPEEDVSESLWDEAINTLVL